MSNLVNILSWIIFGSVIASFGYLLRPGLRSIKPYIYGISGAFIAGIIANVVLNIPLSEFSLVSFMLAICGACFFVMTPDLLRNIR